MCVSKLEEASTHKSAKTHASNALSLVILTFDLLTLNWWFSKTHGRKFLCLVR